MGLELLWRGWSHVSMFFAGGTCFVLFGALNRTGLWFPLRAFLGAVAITAIELFVGLTVNADYHVWDYRAMPFQYRGQICLPFSLLWYPVSTAGIWLHERLNRRLSRILRLPTIDNPHRAW